MSLSNNSTPSQSVEMVDPEGSCKKGNSEPVNSQNGLRVILSHAEEFNALCEWMVENHPGILSTYFKEKREASQ